MKLLDDMEVATYIIGKETTGSDLEKAMAEFGKLLAQGKQVAFVVRKGALEFDGKVKYLVLLGVTKEKIAETARKCGFDNIIMTESLEEAVKVCAENAESGDAVLLSPACASWGDFKDYTQRGELFRQYVMELPE